MNNLYVDPTAQALIEKWKEAKANEAGWNAVRKEAEAALVEQYRTDFERLVDDLNKTTSLTTTIALGDLEVTVGNGLEIDQAAAAEFLRAHPAMLGVLLKAEYKPTSSAVVIGKLHMKDAVGNALAKVATFKDKTPGFALK